MTGSISEVSSVKGWEASLKNTHLEKKKKPFNLNQKVKNNLLKFESKVSKNFKLGGIRPPPALLNYPSTLLSNKGALLLIEEPFSENNFIRIFISNKQFLNFSYFSLENFYYIFCASVLPRMRHNAIKSER